MATGKQKRSPKRSKEIHGGGGRMRNLTEVQKVLLGKGLLDSFKPVYGPRSRPETSI